MEAAFFDLDRTLVRVNSGTLWFKRQRREGRIRLSQAAEAAFWILCYSAGVIDGERVMARAARAVAGDPEEDLALRTRIFWDEEVRPTVVPGALRALEQHRAAGRPCVILTGGTHWIAECARQHLGMDGALGLRLESEAGRLTGRVAVPAFGAAKIALAEAWAAPRGIDLQKSWFYTDSITDRPMLERVGRPVVVQPDPRLARLAGQKGWPVEDWG